MKRTKKAFHYYKHSNFYLVNLNLFIIVIEEVETHMIEKQQCSLSVCGRFKPSDFAVKIQKRMNWRVEIREIHDFGGSSNGEMESTK